MQKTVVSLCLAPQLSSKPPLWSQHLPESPSLVLGALTPGTIVVSHVIPAHYLLPSFPPHRTVGPSKRKRPPKFHLDLKRHLNSHAEHPRRPLAPRGPPSVLPSSAKVATRILFHTHQTSDNCHHTSCPCRAANPRGHSLCSKLDSVAGLSLGATLPVTKVPEIPCALLIGRCGVFPPFQANNVMYLQAPIILVLGSSLSVLHILVNCFNTCLSDRMSETVSRLFSMVIIVLADLFHSLKF